MRATAGRVSFLAAPRSLMALALCLGLVATSVSEEVFGNTATVVYSSPSDFSSGTVDISGLIAGSTASTLPSVSAFRWETGGAGANCASVLTLPDNTAQAMLPGHYCVAPITLHNLNAKSLDAWLRIRLVRATVAGNAAADALNDRMRFYMHEYSAGTGRTAAQYQTDDCTPGAYKPVPVVAGTAKSTASIPDTASASLGSRTALTSIGVGGKNIGTHPGQAVPADAAVAALVGSGFGISAGTSLGAIPTETSSLDTSNMSTNPATRNSFNIVGNDEVTNPREINNSNAPNGTRPNGTLPEGTMSKLTSRYFCAAIFFPSDTGVGAANAAGDNAAAAGSLSYHLVVTAAQQASRTVAGSTPTPAPTATRTPTPTPAPSPTP